MVPKIMFVCLGNICRSPTAEGVLRGLAAIMGIDVMIESCGTSGWHNGNPPDTRAVAEAARRGFDLSHQRSSQIKQSDFTNFDLILCMDQSNLDDVRKIAPNDTTAEIKLFLDYAPDQPLRAVPDPYYEDNFEFVFDLIERASMGLLDEIKNNA